jgi:hypothetical protein
LGSAADEPQGKPQLAAAGGIGFGGGAGAAARGGQEILVRRGMGFLRLRVRGETATCESIRGEGVGGKGVLIVQQRRFAGERGGGIKPSRCGSSGHHCSRGHLRTHLQ